LPQLVKPLLSAPHNAVWLLPTQEFRESVVESRGGPAWGFLAKTSEPKRALHNLLERDRLFTNLLREETSRLELSFLEVDPGITEDDLVKRVSETFGL
jgi:hypothetical protein